MQPMMMAMMMMMVMVRAKKEMPWFRATMDEWAGRVLGVTQPEGAQG